MFCHRMSRTLPTALGAQAARGPVHPNHQDQILWGVLLLHTFHMYLHRSGGVAVGPALRLKEQRLNGAKRASQLHV